MKADNKNNSNSLEVGYMTNVEERMKREKSEGCKVIVFDPEIEFAELMKEGVIKQNGKRINPFEIMLDCIMVDGRY